jgi:hypothetical protein
MSDTRLRIYMNDQLALGLLWREMARRAARENAGTETGAALSAVARGIAEDVETFRSMMDRLGLRRNVVKSASAVVLERIGRVKLNGSLTSYSPLSRFSELEFLVIGIEGKKQLWSTLRELAGLDARLADVDFDALIERAASQKATLEPHRVRAGRQAFLGAAEPVVSSAAHPA